MTDLPLSLTFAVSLGGGGGAGRITRRTGGVNCLLSSTDGGIARKASGVDSVASGVFRALRVMVAVEQPLAGDSIVEDGPLADKELTLGNVNLTRFFTQSLKWRFSRTSSIGFSMLVD